MSDSPKKPSQILREARAKIEKPENWIKGHHFASPDGTTVNLDIPPDVCGYCAVGAVIAVLPHRCNDDSFTKVCTKLAGTSGRYSITIYNDDPNTTHSDILGVFDKAIALAEQDEAGREKNP